MIETDLKIGGGESYSIGAVIELNSRAINFIDHMGQEWLQSGYITQDFNGYPDAFTNTVFLQEQSLPSSCTFFAYSPTLDVWVTMYSANSGTSYKTYISIDNGTIFTINENTDNPMRPLGIKWDPYLGQFYAFGVLTISGTTVFKRSIDGLTWIDDGFTISFSTLACGDKGVIASTDGTAHHSVDGSNFTEIDVDITSALKVTYIAEMGLYIITGLKSAVAKVYTSVDGQNFNLVLSGVGGVNAVPSVAYNPSSGLLFAFMKEGTFTSEDGANFLQKVINFGQGVEGVYDPARDKLLLTLDKRKTYETDTGTDYTAIHADTADYHLDVVNNRLVKMKPVSYSGHATIQQSEFKYIGSGTALLGESVGAGTSDVNNFVRIK